MRLFLPKPSPNPTSFMLQLSCVLHLCVIIYMHIINSARLVIFVLNDMQSFLNKEFYLYLLCRFSTNLRFWPQSAIWIVLLFTEAREKHDLFSLGHIKLEIFVSQPGSNILQTVEYVDLLLRGEIWGEVIGFGVTIYIRAFKSIWKPFTWMSIPETVCSEKNRSKGIPIEYQF